MALESIGERVSHECGAQEYQQRYERIQPQTLIQGGQVRFQVSRADLVRPLHHGLENEQIAILKNRWAGFSGLIRKLRDGKIGGIMHEELTLFVIKGSSDNVWVRSKPAQDGLGF